MKRYVSPEHFALIYENCDAAKQPDGFPFELADWWRALLSFCYMTGWRIGESLSLRDEDSDLVAGTAITRAANNKGKRDELVPLHPVVVEHLQKIRCFSPLVFPWNKSRKVLATQFHSIQEAAGIHLPCHDEHEHTPACHLYGFHDLRRGFATVNVATLSAEALQRLMRHKSYTTTQRYINMAGQLNQSLEDLHVLDVLRKAN